MLLNCSPATCHLLDYKMLNSLVNYPLFSHAEPLPMYTAKCTAVLSTSACRQREVELSFPKKLVERKIKVLLRGSFLAENEALSTLQMLCWPSRTDQSTLV